MSSVFLIFGLTFEGKRKRTYHRTLPFFLEKKMCDKCLDFDDQED